MTLEQAFFVSGIVGTIGVIVSLLYLAVEVRHNTLATRMSTGRAVTEDLRTLYRYSAEADSADIVYRGFQDIANLDGSERLRFYAMMHDYFFAFQNAFFQKDAGTLDDRYWSAAVSSLKHLGTFPGVRGYWIDRKFYYAEDFIAFVEREVMKQRLDARFDLAGTAFKRPSSGTDR
jgi:hypothetical protein